MPQASDNAQGQATKTPKKGARLGISPTKGASVVARILASRPSRFSLDNRSLTLVRGVVHRVQLTFHLTLRHLRKHGGRGVEGLDLAQKDLAPKETAGIIWRSIIGPSTESGRSWTG